MPAVCYGCCVLKGWAGGGGSALVTGWLIRLNENRVLLGNSPWRRRSREIWLFLGESPCAKTSWLAESALSNQLLGMSIPFDSPR